MLNEEKLVKLEQYQEILTQRVAIEREVHDIPRSLDVQRELLSRMKRSCAEKREAFIAAETRVRDLKGSLAEAEASRDHAERQMGEIKTQREYEALNKEIREAAEKEQNCRKDLQQEEKQLSELDESLRREEAMISLQETEIAQKSSWIDSEREKLEHEIERLKVEGEELSRGIEKDILDKFERIIRSKQNVGIVPIKGCVCTGCYMILPAQFVNDVRQQDRIVFCPYCSRILKYQDTGEQEGDQLFIDIEAGSLADLEDEYADEGEDESFDDESDEGDDKDPAVDDSDS